MSRNGLLRVRPPGANSRNQNLPQPVGSISQTDTKITTIAAVTMTSVILRDLSISIAVAAAAQRATHIGIRRWPGTGNEFWPKAPKLTHLSVVCACAKIEDGAFFPKSCAVERQRQSP